jgi:hypothetical protein
MVVERMPVDDRSIIVGIIQDRWHCSRHWANEYDLISFNATKKSHVKMHLVHILKLNSMNCFSHCQMLPFKSPNLLNYNQWNSAKKPKLCFT